MSGVRIPPGVPTWGVHLVEMCYNKFMNITKLLKNIFKTNMNTEFVPRVPDKTITIDWAKREQLMINRNRAETFGF